MASQVTVSHPRVTFVAACMCIFLIALSVSGLYPVLTLLVEERIRSDDTSVDDESVRAQTASIIGNVQSISGFSNFLSVTPVALASDRLSSRRFLMAAVALCIACNATSVAFAPTKWWIYGCALLFGVCGGCWSLFALCFAIASDVSPFLPKVTQHQLYSVVESFLYLGVAAGPLFSGYLCDYLSPKMVLLSLAGYAVLASLVSAFMISTRKIDASAPGVYTSAVDDEEISEQASLLQNSSASINDVQSGDILQKGKERSLLSTVWSLTFGPVVTIFGNPATRWTGLQICTFLVGLQCIISSNFIYFQEYFHYSARQYGFVATGSFVVQSFSAMVSLSLVPRFGDRIVSIMGTSFGCIGFGMFGLGRVVDPSLYWILASIAMYSLKGGVFPNARSRLVSCVRSSIQGQMLGAAATLECLASLVMPAILGKLFSLTLRSFPGSVYFVAAGSDFAGVMILLFCIPWATIGRAGGEVMVKVEE